MPRTEETYTQFADELRELAVLESCASLLGWDEQTYLPTGGGRHRADQLKLMAGLIYDRRTSSRLGDLIASLEQSGDLGPDDSPMAVNVREARRDYDLATKLPRRLVEALSEATSLGQQAWVQARKASDFSAFLPWLSQIITLKREEAGALGYGDGVPYDALLDQYEPGATTQWIKDRFEPLRDELVPFVQAIHDAPHPPDASLLERSYPVAAQQQFVTQAAQAIGFNFDRGRLDVTTHPFCSGIGPGDCRLTTRYNERFFNSGLFSVLHEAGHGIYEQGLEPKSFGLAMGQTVSLGIHESQSLMWENYVGRGRPFWDHFYPLAQAAFPEALANVPFEDFYRAINHVKPSFIRVEADNVTYPLHIMLRFEIEQQLIAGALSPEDVPGLWNELSKSYLGITPPDDARGCLQDIHWSAGLIGYFPTYALGHMYAAQLFATVRQQQGDLDEQFARGEFSALKQWLNQEVHQRGKQYTAERLVEVVTGKPLSHRDLIQHLHTRFGPVYGLD